MNALRLSLKKSEILRGYKAFSRVIAEGQKFQRGTVRCFVLEEGRAGALLRVGFSVSRSIRNATDRNRARRWMKESFRKHKALISKESLYTNAGVTIVFLCTAQSRAVHNTTARSPIEQSIVTLLKDLHAQFVEKS